MQGFFNLTAVKGAGIESNSDTAKTERAIISMMLFFKKWNFKAKTLYSMRDLGVYGLNRKERKDRKEHTNNDGMVEFKLQFVAWLYSLQTKV